MNNKEESSNSDGAVSLNNLGCCIPECKNDACFKPLFGVIAIKGKTRALYRVEVVVQLQYCEPHSMILNPHHILTPPAMDDLEARLKENGRIKPNDMLLRKKISVKWLPLNHALVSDKRRLEAI